MYVHDSLKPTPARVRIYKDPLAKFASWVFYCPHHYHPHRVTFIRYKNACGYVDTHFGDYHPEGIQIQ